jgi:hypothetical protein
LQKKVLITYLVSARTYQHSYRPDPGFTGQGARFRVTLVDSGQIESIRKNLKKYLKF